MVVTNREESNQRIFEFLGVGSSRETREYFEKEMPAERVRIGKYRDEIKEWRELDRAYEEALVRLRT